jgi:multidrug efflux pump
MDIDLTNPEITLTVDRQRAMTEGHQLLADRPAVAYRPFGLESSKIKEGKDEYKIYIRNLEFSAKT